MKLTFTGKKMEVTDAMKEYTDKKLSKLDKFFRDEPEGWVTFSKERGRSLVEVTVKSNDTYFRISENTSDMYACIDAAETGIERQIRRNKTRLEKRLRSGSLEDLTAPVGDTEDEAKAQDEFPIVRAKKFTLKPMTAEEACMQMELLGHHFFVFRNLDDNEAFAVVYKRTTGGYGIIEGNDEDTET